MAVIRRKAKADSKTVWLMRLCCSLVQCASQFVVVLSWGLTLGVMLAVYKRAGSSSGNSNAAIPQQQQEQQSLGHKAALPLGPDGLPSLSALLDQQKGIRGASSSNHKPVDKIAQQNANLNPNNCPLPPNCKIVEIPTPTTEFKLAVWSDGDFISDTIATKKLWEIETVQDMAALAISGTLPPPAQGAFYDVGANVGYYSFLFAAAGYQVVAIEPDPTNAALLAASVCLNAPDLQVQVVETAMTNAAEAAMPHCRLAARVNARTLKYLHSIPRLFCPTPEEQCDLGKDKICVEDVAVATLATIVKQGPAAAIVKIDVEGHEVQVLEGLLDDDANLPVTIQFENKDNRVQDKLAAMLQAKGYTVGTARGHDYNTVAERATE